jgi:hypothetical protein
MLKWTIAPQSCPTHWCSQGLVLISQHRHCWCRKEHLELPQPWRRTVDLRLFCEFDLICSGIKKFKRVAGRKPLARTFKFESFSYFAILAFRGGASKIRVGMSSAIICNPPFKDALTEPSNHRIRNQGVLRSSRYIFYTIPLNVFLRDWLIPMACPRPKEPRRTRLGADNIVDKQTASRQTDAVAEKQTKLRTSKRRGEELVQGYESLLQKDLNGKVQMTQFERLCWLRVWLIAIWMLSLEYQKLGHASYMKTTLQSTWNKTDIMFLQVGFAKNVIESNSKKCVRIKGFS